MRTESCNRSHSSGVRVTSRPGEPEASLVVIQSTYKENQSSKESSLNIPHSNRASEQLEGSRYTNEIRLFRQSQASDLHPENISSCSRTRLTRSQLERNLLETSREWQAAGAQAVVEVRELMSATG